MTDKPTADDIAWAIVAAARETGEDPVRCIQREPSQRCRHYALHALVAVFPAYERTRFAHMVGCPGKSYAFWNNSWNQVARPINGATRRMVVWWDELAFKRVITAIREARAPRSHAFFAGESSMRREPVPVEQCENVTAIQMGDPPFARSALAERQSTEERIEHD